MLFKIKITKIKEYIRVLNNFNLKKVLKIMKISLYSIILTKSNKVC